MTNKIQTRPFQYGNEKESDWPPEMPEGRGFSGYWDSDLGKFVEGRPPRKTKKYGEAPMYISDVMPETRHPGSGEVVDSRSRWNRIDKANGWVTTGSFEDTGVTKKRYDPLNDHQSYLDRIDRAVTMIDDGTAPLSEKTREQARQTDEILSSTLGFDAGNVLGRKKNGRTRKYRR
jgi:hypothetical protein